MIPVGDPVYGGVNYTATGYFMQLLCALDNGRDPGTGILPFSAWGKNIMGKNLPPILLDYAVGQQINLFGGYPTKKDIAPLAVFVAVFLVILILHLVIFFINLSRQHNFILNLYWAFYCLVRVIGFALRIVWANDITKVELAIADEVLLVVASILLVAANLVLAQRLFTWRHPVGGNRKLFNNVMYGLYAIVLCVLCMTILASAVPYDRKLSVKAFWSYKICVMVSAILIILYSLTAISLLGLSYFFKPTRKDENLYTYQPWWIESFHPLYFVKKNAAREAEETFMKRNHNHRHAIRVIAATHHDYNMVEGLTNHRGDLKHNKSILIILIATVFLFISAIGRAVAVFQANSAFRGGKACNPVFMYICWGLFEVIINAMYIVGRVDLRFYRPDVLPAKVRAIITAEQSVMVSDEEEDLNYSDQDDFYMSSDQFDYEEKPETTKDTHLSPNNFDTSSTPYSSDPPYPLHESKILDEDEFRF